MKPKTNPAMKIIIPNIGFAVKYFLKDKRPFLGAPLSAMFEIEIQYLN